MKKISLLAYLTFFGLIISCKKNQQTENSLEVLVKEKKSFNKIEDLNEFDTPGINWIEVGGLYSNSDSIHHIKAKKGKGILLNTNNKPKKHLFSNLKHRDIELDLEFLVPKKSNSGIYFQGRYEIQIYDSWGIKEPKHSDCGGVYNRWDYNKPEGQKGYEGAPPKVNASKPPGEWQHYNIVFRAPKFDNNGKKISNATFEKVIHNGIVIHENVELTGHTRAAAFTDETSEPAPIMIQGDHGPVAFRNIKYRKL